jgi:prolyl oligopeptidase
MPLDILEQELVHGTVVTDPYRWLEDRSLLATEDWIRREQTRCASYFAHCSELNTIESLVRQYLDVEVIDQPVRVADRYFYRKRSKRGEQGKIYVRTGNCGAERVLVDPTKEGEFISVGIYRISSEGSLIAYQVKRGGEDRGEIRIVDVNKCTILPDRLLHGYGRGFVFSSNGYFYCQETDRTSHEHTICFQSWDAAGPGHVVLRVARETGSRLTLTASTYYLGAIYSRLSGKDRITSFWIASLQDKDNLWMEVFRDRRHPCAPILFRDRILVLTEASAGSSALIELSQTGELARVFVPEKKAPIQRIVVTGEQIYVSYLESGITAIDRWLSTGEQGDSVSLPEGGAIQMLPSYGPETDSVFYTLESIDAPPTIYEHDPRMNRSVIWHQRQPSVTRRQSRVEQVVYTSRDGAQIPLTLVSSDGERSANPRPVIMTSYGGFGVTMTQKFSVLVAIMMELGATFALPHIRGGGEFGKAWHEAGRARNRQSTFDDFIAAAEWLCEKRISSPNQLGIFGGSNSGLLVGAAMTQRPDLFGAVLCIAPLLDMLRYETFDQAIKWREEYGTIDDPEDFRALYAYSPYHHIAEDVNYPATLFVTGDKDDRCNPAHVRKTAARLQDRPAQKSSIVVDYSEERGHCPVLPLSVRISALARRIAFLCQELHIPISSGGLNETTYL